jgi:hypothetical protein
VKLASGPDATEIGAKIVRQGVLEFRTEAGKAYGLKGD